MRILDGVARYGKDLLFLNWESIISNNKKWHQHPYVFVM
jgi:hypothetical protein